MTCFNFTKEATEQILIENPVSTDDGQGGRIETWETQSNVWAVVKPKSDFMRNQSEQLQAMVTHDFVVRYQDALADVKDTSKYRITLDGRFYDIVGIKNVDQSLKNYGRNYQIIKANENGPDV